MESRYVNRSLTGWKALVVPLVLLTGAMSPTLGATPSETVGELSLDGIYWPMLGGDIYNTHRGFTDGRGLQDPYLKWSDGDNSTATGATGSDMTGNTEFVGISPRTIRFIVDSNRTNVMIRDGNDGRIAWSADVRDIEDRLTAGLFTSPCLLDTDSDDRVEVAVVISDGSTHQVALFEPNITLTGSGYDLDPDSAINDLMWISIFGPQGTSRSSSPLVHDITGDGVEDIVFGAGNRLYAYNGRNGTLIWYLDVGSLGDSLSTPAVFPGSGSIRRIVVNSLSANRRTMRTTTVNFNGNHLKNQTEDLTPALIQYPYPGTIVPMPVISDLSGNGNPFIIVPVPAISNYGRLKVYSYALNPVMEIDDIVGTYDGFLAVGDIGGEPGDEIFIQSRRSGFPSSLVSYEIFHNGEQYDSRRVWSREIQIPTAYQYSPPLVCDLNGDSIPDVIFFNPGLYSAILSDGSYYWNQSVPVTPVGSGLVGDLNDDNFLDIYLNGYMYSQKLIDLKVKEPFTTNIYLDDPEPVEGTSVTINCVVENTWNTEVDDVVVRFVDIHGTGSDPVLIGYDRISLTDTAESSIEWVPVGEGEHTIAVLIDPDDNITETDEGNNQGDASFTVLPAFPDLTITGIHFKRGDGLLIGEERLVENDPSEIIVTVENIGQTSSTGGEVRVNVNGGPPTGGEEFTDIGPIERSGWSNISVPWTPYGISSGQEEESFLIDAWVSVPLGKQEISLDNNHLSNTTDVKNRTPVGSLYLKGIIADPSGEPEEGVRVTLELARTGETLGPVTSSSDGRYGFDMNFLDYLDADTVTVRASKDMMWGENSTLLYSEDVEKNVNIDLTDVPTLSLFISFDGEMEEDVDPGQSVSLNFIVENNGNVMGDVTVTKDIGGNSSLATGDVSLSPATFTLSPGGKREVVVSYTVPNDENPLTRILLGVNCTISSNDSYSRKIVFDHTVKGKEMATVRLISNNEMTIGPDSSSTVSLELYIYNSGNVPFSYQIYVSSSIEDHVIFRDGSGILEPDSSVSPFVDLTIPNATESLSGIIHVSTSGLGTLGNFEISVRRVFPDLGVKGVIGSEPADPVLGYPIQIFASIDNHGDIGVSGVKCSFFEGDTLLGTRTVERTLLPGEQATITGITWTPTVIGDHTITFRVDPDNEITEIEESDNDAERTFSFYPDISIRKFTMDNREPNVGDTVKASITLENEGNAPLTRGFRVTLTMDSLSGEQLISDAFDDVMDPRRDPSAKVDLMVVIPEETGTRKIFVLVEPVTEDDIEQDTDDNTASFQIDISTVSGGWSFRTIIPFLVAAIIIIIVLALGLYIWRFGLPSNPPPGDDQEEYPEDEDDVKSGSDEEGVLPPDEETDIMEMEVVPEEDASAESSPVVAEVIEEDENMISDEDQEESVVVEV